MTEMSIAPEVKIHLTRLLDHLNISDYSLNIAAGSGKGDNFLGEIASVHVKGKDKNGENLVLDLIVKSAPSDGLMRHNFPMRIAYEREIYIYSHVFPEYTKIQQERHVKKPFKSFPKFYQSTMEDLSEALIMENKKVEGFKLASRFIPVDYNHARLVVQQYGQFHALSLAIKDQKPEVFKELAANTQERVKVEGRTTENEIEYMGMKFDEALETLDPAEDAVAYAKLKELKERRVDRLHSVLKSEEAGDFAVIGHGDCWLNNLLFKYGDPEQPTVPTEVCILDWQLSRLASPALDLGYFIFTCTDKTLRDQHYDDLINEYYNSLSSLLRELGSNPEKLFPYKVLQEHLKRFSVYGLFMAINILKFISSDISEMPDVKTIQNPEEAKQKFSYALKNSEKYRSRMRDVILDFVKYNYDLI